MRFVDLTDLALEKGRSRGISPLEAELLLCWAFRIPRSRYWSSRLDPVRNRRGRNRFFRGLRRLLRGEPLDHLLGRREFYSRSFRVNRRVLVPRPETEILVDQALARLHPEDRVLEIGAGSGCVAVTLAREAGACVTALEISRPAIRILRRNIREHGVRDRVTSVRGNLFPRRGGPWDMVVSNPPYLSAAEWRELPPRIRRYEPRRALVAGSSGTEALERIVAGAFSRLHPGGWLLLETGHRQARAVAAAMAAAGFRDIRVAPDLAGIERVVCARRDPDTGRA